MSLRLFSPVYCDYYEQSDISLSEYPDRLDAAEGLLTSVILLIAKYLPPTKVDGKTVDCRHIVSVFKLVQDLLALSKVKGKSQFQLLMDKLPSDHKTRRFAGAALKRADP